MRATIRSTTSTWRGMYQSWFSRLPRHLLPARNLPAQEEPRHLPLREPHRQRRQGLHRQGQRRQNLPTPPRPPNPRLRRSPTNTQKITYTSGADNAVNQAKFAGETSKPATAIAGTALANPYASIAKAAGQTKWIPAVITQSISNIAKFSRHSCSPFSDRFSLKSWIWTKSL